MRQELSTFSESIIARNQNEIKQLDEEYKQCKARMSEILLQKDALIKQNREILGREYK